MGKKESMWHSAPKSYKNPVVYFAAESLLSKKTRAPDQAHLKLVELAPKSKSKFHTLSINKEEGGLLSINTSPLPQNAIFFQNFFTKHAHKPCFLEAQWI